MAEEKKKPEYSAEELQIIQGLTSMFNLAPGQVAPETSEAGGPGFGPPAEETGLEADLAEEETPEEAEEDNRPAPPKLKFTSLDEDDFDLDQLLNEPVPAPADQEELPPEQALPDLGDLGEPEAPAAAEQALPDFGDLGEPEAPAAAEQALPDFGDLGDFEAPATAEQALPDFGDLGEFEAPAAQKQALPDFGDLGEFEAPATAEQALPDFGDQDEFETPTATQEQAMPDLGNLAEFETPAKTPPADDGPPRLGDLAPQVAISSASRAADFYGSEDLTDQELSQLRNTLKGYPYAIRKFVIDSILANKLPAADIRELTRRILDGAKPEEIKKDLEEKLGQKIDEKATAGSRVIVSRSQYTDAGLQRQAALIKRTRFAALTIFSVLVLGNLSYFALIKPLIYRNLVKKGKEIILNQEHTSDNLQKAEEFFSTALEYYPTRTYAFLQYAEAYKRQGLYEQAFEKLFGRVSLEASGKAIRFADREINHSADFWPALNKVPVVQADPQNDERILINNLPWKLEKKGAYLVSHLDEGKDDAAVLIALGYFHSNPVNRFKQSPYRNNLLGIDYFQRLLTFEVKTPMFEQEEYLSRAVMGIGDVYYNQKDYYRSLDYFEKIIRQDPYSVAGQTGVLKSLLKIYRETNDPRLIIQQHSLIKHKLNIEEKLPLFILARLAEFYIDLPDDDNLRIQYNVSPVDAMTGRALKERIPQALDILYRSSEKDIYDNVKEGKSFAEGFYQRGRYYLKTVKEVRMALKQMEYAYLYDKRHFPALALRAEMLMQLNDYAAAAEHLKLAMELINPEKLSTLGDLPEDETLLEADIGRVYFDMGKALYLTALKNLGQTEDWQRIQEVQKYTTETDYGTRGLAEALDQVDRYFDQASDSGLKDRVLQAELGYYSGWSHYARGNYRLALQHWESLDPAIQQKYKNLELAKSHALFKLSLADRSHSREHLRASLGYLLYLQGEYAQKAGSISNPSPGNKYHVRIFSRLAIIENNMGAIYEKLDDEENALQHYWRSVDASKKIARENEVANLNIRLSFKRAGLEEFEANPLIMDYIPPQLEEDIL